jgi:hypothetical protein
MKSVPVLFLSAIYALAQTGTSPTPADPNAQKARLVLQQAIQALGGDAYLNVQDMQQQGRSYTVYHGQVEGGGPFWRFWKWPDKDRVELTKQRDVVYIYNGDQGYEKTYKGVRPENRKDLADYLKARNYSLEYVLRRWLNQPGVALFYDGATLAENRPADRVSLLNPANQVVTLFIDSSTHLPIEKSYTLRDPDTRERDEDVEIYDNYHRVQGINTPYDIVRKHNGEVVRQRFLERISYNTGLADSLFSPMVTYDPDAKKH